MKKYVFLIVCLIFMSGCSKAKYLNELLALKKVGDEQVAMAEIVAEQNRNFDIMLDDIRSGEIENYKQKNALLERFGKPIFVKKISRQGKSVEKWLYRYATQYFGSDKVVFYINEDGFVEDREYTESK